MSAASSAVRAAAHNADTRAYAADAVSAAARAAKFAFSSDAAREVWTNVSKDADLVESGTSVAALASQPLWHGQVPRWATDVRAKLEQGLPTNEDWEVWSRWYQDVVRGSQQSEAYDLTFLGWKDGVFKDIWTQGPAAANRWIKEHLPSETQGNDVPPARPATIEPVLIGEIIRLSNDPLKADLAHADLAAALAAAKSRFARLIGEIEGQSNIDPRFAEILKSFVDRFPSELPDTQGLFDIGHELSALRGYEATVNKEWPPALSPRFSSAIIALDMTLKKFPKWKEFLAEPKLVVSPEQVERISEISRAVVSSMREEGLRDHIDAAVPASLEDLSDFGDRIGSKLVPMVQAGRTDIARDELESINNLLKIEASILPDQTTGDKIVSALTNEIKEAGGDVKKGAREAKTKMFSAVGGAAVYGPVAFFVLIATNALGVPIFPWLLKNYPTQFGWLESFLRSLGLL